jgi:hypothetical protein
MSWPARFHLFLHSCCVRRTICDTICDTMMVSLFPHDDCLSIFTDLNHYTKLKHSCTMMVSRSLSLFPHDDGLSIFTDLNHYIKLKHLSLFPHDDGLSLRVRMRTCPPTRIPGKRACLPTQPLLAMLEPLL